MTRRDSDAPPHQIPPPTPLLGLGFPFPSSILHFQFALSPIFLSFLISLHAFSSHFRSHQNASDQSFAFNFFRVSLSVMYWLEPRNNDKHYTVWRVCVCDSAMFSAQFFCISPNRVFAVVVTFFFSFSISLVFLMENENLGSKVEFLLTFDLVCVCICLLI